MHCPQEQQSPSLCRLLYRRLAQLVDLPPLPWDLADGAMQQTMVF
jgi:hypothetical protein